MRWECFSYICVFSYKDNLSEWHLSDYSSARYAKEFNLYQVIGHKEFLKRIIEHINTIRCHSLDCYKIRKSKVNLYFFFVYNFIYFAMCIYKNYSKHWKCLLVHYLCYRFIVKEYFFLKSQNEFVFNIFLFFSFS